MTNAISETNEYLPPNSQSFYTLQMLKGDRRHVSFYEGREHIPYCISRKIGQDCAPYMDSDKGPVTFTARVPLNIVVQGSEAIRSHIEATAFSIPVTLDSCEYRPVGAVIAEFDQEFAGDVLLQVTCAITARS